MLITKTCMYCEHRKDNEYGEPYCSLVKKYIKTNSNGVLHLVCKERGLIK